MHTEMQKFEDLFRSAGYGFQSGGGGEERAYPERVYLIEQGWWQRWSDVSRYLVYRRMLRDLSKPKINKDWAQPGQLFQSNLPFHPAKSNFSFGGRSLGARVTAEQSKEEVPPAEAEKKEITVDEVYLSKPGIGLSQDKVCTTPAEIAVVRDRLRKDRAQLGPMNNRVLLEPMSLYMEDPLADSGPGGSASGDGLPPLIEDFRIDKDAKVVSKEVYDFLKQRHGVLKDPETGEDDQG